MSLGVACGPDKVTDPPVATSLVFDATPNSSAIAGATLSQVRVRVLDASGRTFGDPMTVSLTLTSSNGASLLGTTSATTAGGSATFDDLRVEKAGVGYVLTASAGTLTSVPSNPFDITHATPTKLRFVNQPGDAIAGKPLSPAVTVEITDAYDNRATSAANPVTVTQTAPIIVPSVLGTTTVDAVSGVATFDRITFNRPGSLTLTASAAGLSSATSGQLTVQPTTLARLCPGEVAAGASFAVFLDAMASTQPGGTVVLCDGTHNLSVQVDRPLMIAAEHPHEATVRSTSLIAFQISHVAAGTITIRDLNFVVDDGVALVLGTQATLPPAGRYDQVVFENNRVTMTRPEVYGVLIRQSDVASAKVVLRRNVFTGGKWGVLVESAGSVEVLDNKFIDQTPSYAAGNANIALHRGGPYVVRGNVVDGCALACISAYQTTAAEIADNTLETPVGRDSRVGISLLGANANVVGNTIRGVGAVTNRTDANRYAFTGAAFHILLGGSATINRNFISNAYSGFWSNDAAASGSDNIVTLVHYGVEASAAGLSLHRNDFTDYIIAMLVNPSTPNSPGFLSCNWWGSVDGPKTLASPNPAHYTPFAREPVANKPGVACPPPATATSR
jgi:hypothetical protein